MADPEEARRETATNTESWLWIDAISIDQMNSQEKSEQVPRMGRIYSLARRVIAWLGSNEAGKDADIKGNLCAGASAWHLDSTSYF